MFNKFVFIIKKIFFKKIKVKKELTYITISKSWIKDIRKVNEKCIVVHLNSSYGMRSFISYYKTQLDRDIEYQKLARELGISNE